MQQVADRAGVSISTVSFLVNGTKQVAPETRERILKAIDDLGYRRNVMARALASRRSRILALLYPAMDRNLDLFVASASRAAEARGYTLVVWPITAEHAETAVTSLIDTGIADGVILLEVKLRDERVERLQAAGAPFVLIGRTAELAGIDWVDIAFERTTAEAVQYLADFGHRDLTLVVEDFTSTPLTGYAPPARVEESFLATAADLGLEAAVMKLPRDLRPELTLTDRIVHERPDTTAIVIMHPDAMFALANGFRRRGIGIPRDISLVSVATSPTASALVDPAVTTWATPGEPLGALAADLLVDRLEGREPRRVDRLVDCRRHDGSSVARAPAARAPLDELSGRDARR